MVFIEKFLITGLVFLTIDLNILTYQIKTLKTVCLITAKTQ
tara:strand:- start:1459 stop:1581 length:123 start_codon:yes stop_codon:yes gene_type:complete